MDRNLPNTTYMITNSTNQISCFRMNKGHEPESSMLLLRIVHFLYRQIKDVKSSTTTYQNSILDLTELREIVFDVINGT